MKKQPQELTTAETDFIHELEHFLDRSFNDFSRARITHMLDNYRKKRPYMKVVKSDPVIMKEIMLVKYDPKLNRVKIANKIMKMVCRLLNLTKAQLFSKCREKTIVYGRHLCMYFINKCAAFSLSEIGKMFGGRDHTTVIHGKSRLLDLVETDPNTKKHFDLLSTMFTPA